MTITVYGDESSSSAHATYGLLAIANAHLPLLATIIADAKRALKAPETAEPIHAKVLFHNGPRSKSAFSKASLAEVEQTCALLIDQVAQLESAFFLGRVERNRAPKVFHVPLVDPNKPDEVLYGTTKVELTHLQLFAYGAASARACHVLPAPAERLVLDENKSVVKWFNEHRQAGRLQETFWMDATMPKWPAVTFGDDMEHPGLQVADVLTYFATKQLFQPRFSFPFDFIRHKTTFLVYEFAEQVCRPYIPPAGVTVRSLPKRK